MATEIGTVSTKGQVAIPREIRKALHIRPRDKILFDLEGRNRVLVRKAEPQRLNYMSDRLGPSKETGVETQRWLRRE